MKLRTCSNCGKENSYNAWNCIECGETLSINTIVDAEKTKNLRMSPVVSNKNSTQDHLVSSSRTRSKLKLTDFHLAIISVITPVFAWAMLGCYVSTIDSMLFNAETGHEAIGLLAGIGLIIPIGVIFFSHLAGFFIGTSGIARIMKAMKAEKTKAQNQINNGLGKKTKANKVPFVIGTVFNAFGLIAFLLIFAFAIT